MFTIKKRDGKEVIFDKSKIEGAILNAFFDEEFFIDGNHTYRDNAKRFTEEITGKVLMKIKKDYGEASTISVEDIQDIVEDTLMKSRFKNVAKSYIKYRHKRTLSRQRFLDNQSKLIKTIEDITFKDSEENDLKRENANINGNSAMGTMLQYGSNLSKEFAITHVLDEKHSKAHNNGDIHIHDLDFYAMGTTTCCQINLEELFKDGFSTGHGFIREPQSIMTYAALSAIAIQANQNDQHGGQSVNSFDYYLAPGVLKTFIKLFKEHLEGFLLFDSESEYIMNKFECILSFIDDNVKTIELNDDFFNETIVRLMMIGVPEKNAEKIVNIAFEKAIKSTEKQTYQAMESLVHNLNTMNSRAGSQVPFSSINFGTDTSEEGRMVSRNLLLAMEKGLGKGETAIFPILIFKVKEGINYNPEDINYDLFKLAIRVSAKRLFPNFSFIDAPFNLQYYEEGNHHTEVGYMGCRTRVMANVNGPEISSSRGNLSFTTINLPRLGIKHGTLTVGFIGLAECLKALIGKHHGESEEAQRLGLEIIGFIRNRLDQYVKEYSLNFSLIATPAEGLSGRFTKLDKELYGELEGITDKEYYTNSFHVPVGYDIGAYKKIKIEAPYHSLTNAGHISYVEFDGSPLDNLEAFEKIVRLMKESGIGYGSINHPVDRDPVCGYTGIIGDTCPSCGREEDSIKFERIRRITGYLVGTLDRFNDSKKAEEKDRKKHM